MYAPSRRLIVLATASSSGAGSFAISAAMTSVSELVRSRIPSAASSSRSVDAFVRLPLCPSVTVRARPCCTIGCAFVQSVEPVVE